MAKRRMSGLPARCAAMALAIGGAGPAPNAQPQGGQVTAGAAGISQTPGGTTVTQSSPRAVIDWRSFNVGGNQAVTFQQPSASAVTLNRVDGANPSEIAGRIDANGQVVLVNPSGVVFSRGSQVNAQSLVVSAAGIANQDFMAGRMAFGQAPNPGARVQNDGTITVQQAGLAALVAPQVANSGVIRAKMGHVILAGAQTHTLDLYGDGLLSLDVTSQVRQAPAGGAALVTNTGLVEASGGTVLLTASAADGVVQNLVTAGGRIYADTLGGRTGTVVVSGAGGSVQVLGALRAAGRAAGSLGGQVQVNATGGVSVASGARVDASGQAGGGTVAVGTTLARAAGGASVAAPMAASVTVALGATLAADAMGRGNGGRVTVLSAGRTAHAGRISVRGGPQGGDGGAAEVSGGTVALTGGVDAAAPKGQAGTVLLDPLDLTISATPTGDYPITAPGAAAPNVPYGGQPDGSTSSVITPAAIQALAGNVTLQATRDLFVNDPVTLSNPGQGLTLQAGRNLAVGAALTVPGPLYLQANTAGTGAALLSVNAPVSGGTVFLSGSNVVPGGFANGIIVGTSGLVTATAATGRLISIACDCAVQGNAATSFSAPGGTVERGPLSPGVTYALGTLGGVIDAGTYVFGQAHNPVTGAVVKFQDITLDSPAQGTSIRPAVLDLEAAGAITQNTGAFFANVGTLTGSAGSVAITNPSNRIGALGPFAATGGAFVLNYTQGLTVSGAVSAATNVALLSADGTLAVNAPLAAGGGQRISLQAAGFAFGAGARLSVPGGTVELAPGASGSTFALGASASGGLVTVSRLPGLMAAQVRLGAYTDPSGRRVVTAGTISLSGNAYPLVLVGLDLDLQASGSITQAPGTPLLGVGQLSASAPTVGLAAPGNRIASLGVMGAGGGSFAVADSIPVAVNGPLLATSLALAAPGMVFAGLDAPAAAVTLTLGGGTASGRVNVGALSLVAQGGSAAFVNSVIGGVAGGAAAAGAQVAPAPGAAYQLNGCPIGVPNCGKLVVNPPPPPPPPPPATGVAVSDGIANVAASERDSSSAGTDFASAGLLDATRDAERTLPLVFPLRDLANGPLRRRQDDPDLLLPNAPERDY